MRSVTCPCPCRPSCCGRSSKQFERIGGTEVIETDIRFIAATNKDLVALIEKNLFREDLYYRINVIPVYINPLRERMDDMGQLCRHFLDRFKAKYRYDREIIPLPGGNRLFSKLPLAGQCAGTDEHP